MASKENQLNAAASTGGSLGGDVVVKSKGPGMDMDMSWVKAMKKAKKEKKKAAKKGAETKAKNKSSSMAKSSTAIIVKPSMAAVASKPSGLKKAPPAAVVPHEFSVRNNHQGPKITKNGNVDGRSGYSKRQGASMARQAEMKAGTNNTVNANAKRQDLAGGDKKTLLNKLFTAVENDRHDALHGLLLRRKNARKKGRWSINNNGGGPQNLLPGEPWKMLSARLRFPNASKFKAWLTSDSASKKQHCGPQVYKWSSENKKKGLTLDTHTNSKLWKEATLHFELV